MTASIYVPPVSGTGEWATREPQDLGFDRAKLDQAMAYAEAKVHGRVIWKTPAACRA